MTSQAPSPSWTSNTRSRRETARSRTAGRPNQRRGCRSLLGRRISCTSALRRLSRSVLPVVGQRRLVDGQAPGRHPLGARKLAAATPRTGAWSTGRGAFAPNCSSHSRVQAQGVQNEHAPLGAEGARMTHPTRIVRVACARRAAAASSALELSIIASCRRRRASP